MFNNSTFASNNTFASSELVGVTEVEKSAVRDKKDMMTKWHPQLKRGQGE